MMLLSRSLQSPVVLLGFDDGSKLALHEWSCPETKKNQETLVELASSYFCLLCIRHENRSIHFNHHIYFF